MAVQTGKTPTTKKIYFSQAPVNSLFCEHFLSSKVQTTSRLPSASGLIYSSSLFLSLLLQNYTDILTPVLLVSKRGSCSGFIPADNGPQICKIAMLMAETLQK